MFLQGFIGDLPPYIYFEPDFMCIDKSSDPPNKFKCKQIIACENPDGFEVIVKKISIVSLNSLWCDRQSLKSFGISFINFGASVLYFGVNLISDRYGRNMVLRIGTLLVLIPSFICIFLRDFYSNMFFTLFIWLGCDVIVSCSFIYFLEFSSKKLREKCNALIFYSFSFGVITGHVANIGIKDFWVMYLIIFIYTVLTIGVLYFMTDTPFFYYSQKRLKEFEKVMRQIYNVNKPYISTTPGKR
jgi:MFS family permease